MIIDIIFNILKFIILIIGSVYLFKKFFLVSIKKEIKEKNDYIQSLQQERMSIFIHQQQVEKEIEIQNDACKELLLKADVWKKKFDKKINLEQECYYNQKSLIDNKIKEQENYYRLNKFKKKIIVKITDDLKENLEQYFSNKENQENYNKKIINFLNKN